MLKELPVFSAVRSLDNKIVDLVWEMTTNPYAILNHKLFNGYTVARYAAAYANVELLRKIIELR